MVIFRKTPGNLQVKIIRLVHLPNSSFLTSKPVNEYAALEPLVSARLISKRVNFAHHSGLAGVQLRKRHGRYVQLKQF